MDIKKLRRETPGCKHVIHFNNAGASLAPQIVNDAICDYLAKEQITGGYELEAELSKKIVKVYIEAAKLIRAKPSEIALTENATAAFFKAIFSIPFQAGDQIITSEFEYGNNFLNYFRLKKEKGIEIITIPGNEETNFDLDLLKKNINKKTKLIAVTHMPTNCGAIVPVKEIGKIAKENNVLYLVDTCQSIGHYPTFVDELNCDFLTATSRKYLRGPRGLGFLYVNKKILDKVEPLGIEMNGALWISKTEYKKYGTVKMFEAWEKSYALVSGFREALKYANQIGIENIWLRIKGLGEYMREGLSEIKHVTNYDGLGVKSGIVSLLKKGIDPKALHAELRRNNINSSISPGFTSLLDMQKKNLTKSNRLSIHYYNTKKEINKALKIIDKIKT